jgi:hypothetical protein
VAFRGFSHEVELHALIIVPPNTSSCRSRLQSARIWARGHEVDADGVDKVVNLVLRDSGYAGRSSFVQMA